ncbi:hypothetical protein ACJRPK_14115 [Aquimarina sp. 2-A2]|uniref:hypothetical protein n=1 Tax=Aquimarina sp. 2-A2 TaxID=3382644 RepID=UPI00387EED02
MKQFLEILKEGIKEIQSNGKKDFEFLSGFRIINGKWHYNETQMWDCNYDEKNKFDHHVRFLREIENA